MKKNPFIILLIVVLILSLVFPVYSLHNSNIASQLNFKLKHQLNKIIRKIRKDVKLTHETLMLWKQFVKDLHAYNPSADIKAIINEVMNESIGDIMKKNIAFFKAELKFLNNMKNKIRNHINDIKNAFLRGFSKVRKFVMLRVKNFSPTLNILKGYHNKMKFTKPWNLTFAPALATFIINMVRANRQKYNKVLQDRQNELKELEKYERLENQRLKNAMNNQGELMQTSRNISRQLNDTANAIVHNNN